jgi:PmbA protein
MDPTLQLGRRVLDRAVGALDDLEVYVEHRAITTVQASTGGGLRDIGRSDILGIGVRATTGERVGYASTTDTTDSGLDDVLARAHANAEASDADPPGARLPAPVAAQTRPDLCPAALTEMPLDAKVSLVTGLARRVTTLDPRVRRLDTAQWRDERREVAVTSTRGLAASYESAFAELWCDALGEDDHGTASDYAYWWGRDPTPVDVMAVAAEAVSRTVRLLGPPTPIRGSDPVVLDPAVSGLLLEAIGKALTGGALGNLRSPFAGRLGARVAASLVQLSDDGTWGATPRAAPFDDEGVPRQCTQLIEDGVLIGAMHNTATAATSEGAMSTGNAHRNSYKALPRAAATALRLAPSAAKPDTGNATYLQQVTGSGTGISPVTGRVSLGGVGFVMRDGEPAGRLPTVPIASDLLTILSELTYIHEDAQTITDRPVLAPTVEWRPSRPLT